MRRAGTIVRAVAACAFTLTGACALDSHSPRNAAVAVGGDSPLVALFARVGGDTGIAPDTLAATSWVRTRWIGAAATTGGESGERFGLLAIPDADVARAAQLAGVPDAAVRAGDDEAALRAGAALLRADGIAEQAAVDRALSRGIDGRDRDGHTIVVAAHRELVPDGFGTIAQGVNYPGAEWQPASTSNYQVASRAVGDIDHIVIHDTEGGYSGTISWFQDPAAQVSAHYVVRSSDGHVAQMVAEKNIAWHDKCFNTTTVGIEHEGYAAHPDVWYTEAMYAQSAKLTAYLADKYGIAKEHGPIIGHGEAPDCSDHTDPGPGWNWNHYIELVQSGGASQFLAGDLVVDAPATIASGQLATVTVQLANHGTSAWDLDATRLGTQDPQDRDSDLFVDGDWLAPNRATAIDATAAPQAVGTFTFQIRGPDVGAPKVYDEAFQLVEAGDSGDAWFGPILHLVVQVVPADPMTPPSDGGCNTSGAGGLGIAFALVGLRRRRTRR